MACGELLSFRLPQDGVSWLCDVNDCVFRCAAVTRAGFRQYPFAVGADKSNMMGLMSTICGIYQAEDPFFWWDFEIIERSGSGRQKAGKNHGVIIGEV